MRSHDVGGMVEIVEVGKEGKLYNAGKVDTALT